MRPALARCFHGAAALLLVACRGPLPASQAPSAPMPESKAPEPTFTIAGAQLVFEDTWEIGRRCRAAYGLGGSCFVRLGDGLLGVEIVSRPQSFVYIGHDGRVDAREGPLKFTVGDIAFDSEHASVSPIMGRWPDDFFIDGWSPATRRHALVHVRGARATDEGTFLRILAIEPWTQGRTVGIAKDASGWKRVVWDATGRHEELIPGYAAHARLPGGMVIEGEKESTCADEDLVPWEASVLPSGELIVLGLACSSDPAQRAGHIVIDRWSADGATHAIDPLPIVQRPRWASLCPAANGEVNVVLSNFEDRPIPSVGGGAVVAARRPDGWKISAPLDDLADSAMQRQGACAVAADGAVWLNVTHDSRTLEESKHHDGSDFHSISLRRLAPGGRWSRAILPSPWAGATLAAALRDGSLWLSAEGQSHALGLFRLGDGAAPALFGLGGMHPMPAPTAMSATSITGDSKPASIAAPPPPEPCADLFVRFYTLGANTPDDYDFPTTRRTLEGHPAIVGARFVSGVSAGQRVFGAIVHARARADEIAALLRSALPGTAPQITCGSPTVQREHTFRSGPR